MITRHLNDNMHDYYSRFIEKNDIKYDQAKQLLLLLSDNDAIITDAYTIADLTEEFVDLELYEYYDGLHIDYKLSNGIIGDGLIELDDYNENISYINDNLQRMNKLERLSYTSRFNDETTYEFLTHKPKSLHELTLNHLYGLDLKFIDGIIKLTIINYMVDFADYAHNLPSSIKYVVLEYSCHADSYGLTKRDLANINYKITFG